jgi:hypothetical protein
MTPSVPDDAVLWLARGALVLAAAVWCARFAEWLHGRVRWWAPLWPPVLLVVVAALALVGLATFTNESIGEVFDAGLWRDAGGALVSR